jgi:cytidine deaminase
VAHILSNEALIAAARAVLLPHTVPGYRPGGRGRHIAHVGSSLVSGSGTVFSGVSVDTGSGTGFCAEHAAIAAMVTAAEYRILKVVAVYRADTGELYVLPPCGRCREFMRQVDSANLDAEVVLGLARSAPLRDLLPLHEWPEPLG